MSVTEGLLTARPIPPDDRPTTARAAAPPRWFRPGLGVLLVATAVLYTWNLGATGDANSFYAAAVQASTRNPVAWLFAAVDAPGFITVDKPPVANWWMGLWANVLGFSPWSMLLAQAALGVASVALLVLAVRRWSGPGVALGAGAVLALTPVAVIMFRYDEPDPVLTFLLVAAAYCVIRAVDAAPRRAGTGWLVACGLLVGTGFLAKMGMALLAVPALGLVYLVAADVAWPRRIAQLAAGLAGMVVGAGWFIALVSLWPAASRPYIGGSDDNSLWQLAVGYNGVARILGRGSAVGAAASGRTAFAHGGGHGGFGGPGGHGFGGHGGFPGRSVPGIGRLFDASLGGQITWLLPAALLALVALLWLTRSAPRTDRLRAATLLWGTWLVVAAAVLSFMQDMVSTYYPLVMSAPLAALVALGAAEGWRRRDVPAARALLAIGVAGSAVWATVLLSRTPTFVPWLRWVVLVAGLVAAALVLVPVLVSGGAGRPGPNRGLVVAGLVAALVAVAGGPVAYAADTVADPHPGTMVAAGPSVVMRPGAMAWGQQPADPALDDLLAHAGTRWAAAVPSSMSAAGLELASGTSVMGIGGFSGSDPTPTLPAFQADVAAGEIGYYLPDAGRHPMGPARPGAPQPWAGFGRGGASVPITQWVQAHYRPTTVGGQTVYDLRAARS